MNFRKLNRYYLPFFMFIMIMQVLASCSSDIILPESQKQNYFISNLECNNSGSFSYIMADRFIGDTLFFKPKADNIFKQIKQNWVIGQGTGKRYFDTGKEVLFKIKTVDRSNRYITITDANKFSLLKPIVFWNISHISTRVFPRSEGSWSFSKIIFDKKRKHFVSHLFQCDTNHVSIYLAYSDSLSKWQVDNVPILIPDNFQNTYWNAPNNKGEMMVTPLISDIIIHNNQYYLFVYGDNSNDNTFISLITTDSLHEKYNIHKKHLLQFNKESSYSNHDVYYPKVLKYKDKWLMFYTSKNNNNDEVICKAISDDLHLWKTVKENIIPRNTNGWNSNSKNQLTAQVKLSNDTIYLWVTGTKTVEDQNNEFNKGNVQDIAIGKYYSIDGANDFSEMTGNPIFGGNPLFSNENDHVGATFQEIFFVDSTYTFFHSKGVNSPYYKVKYFKR